IWLDYTGQDIEKVISVIKGEEDAELASIILLFLKDSNHKMAITIIAQFYEKILKNELGAKEEFIDICKAIGAFYLIWRSARSNAGLDNVYRHFFKGFTNKDGTIVVDRNLWQDRVLSNVSAREVKSYLISVLEREKININTKSKWIENAKNYLSYKNKKLCKFILFISHHDTIEDGKEQGLMKKSKSGSNNLLSLKNWNSNDLKSLEHVAPQTNTIDWEDTLYENELINSIGNLTLLPQDINSSVGNRSWNVKKIYYKHINEPDFSKVKELEKEAHNLGIRLNPETISLLRSVKFSRHMNSIINVNNWDSKIVSKRTERILDICWDRIFTWLF
ncbi:MAG: HNH endonuclease family protein, partial [Saprospiraceae bacterium]